MDKAQKDDGGLTVPAGMQAEVAETKAPKQLYTDEYIRLWEPLDPLDPDRMTDEHHRAIIKKMYMRYAVVYERLAQL